MRLPSYLVRNRLGTYYLRIVFPQRLRVSFPTLPKEMRRSLRTREPGLAKRYALAFAARYTALLAQLTEDDVTEKNLSQWKLTPLGNGSMQVTQEDGDDPALMVLIVQALANAGHVPQSVMADPLKRAIYTPTASEQLLGKSLLRQVSNGGTGEWLYDAILRFKADMESEGRWAKRETWTGSYEPALREFREIIAPEESEAPKRMIRVPVPAPQQAPGSPTGFRERAIYDLPIAHIDDVHVRAYKSAMHRWPKGWGQGKRGAQKEETTAKDALASGLPAHSHDNLIKKCENIKAFLRWAARDGCIKDGERLANILPSKRRGKGKASANRYASFTLSELKRMFEGTEYQSQVGMTPAQFWIPLIGLYTGARINEISQLDLADLVTRENIRCFHITDTMDADEQDGEIEQVDNDPLAGRKTLKSEAAKRHIPIHPILIEIGLDRYVAQLRADGKTRLFPDLSWESKSGFGRLPSRHFREFTQRCGVYKERKKVFHSFRSTLNETLQERGMDLEKRNRLSGHATNSVNDRHYGGKTALHDIRDQLFQVDFGIDHPPYRASELPAL